MIDIIPSSGSAIDAANPVNWSHPSMQPGVRPVAWYLALPGLMGGGKSHDLMSPADLRIGNHGTLTSITQSGTSGWQPTNRPGGWGEIKLDGVDDNIPCPASGKLRIAGNISISVWAKFGTGGDPYRIFITTTDFVTDSNGYEFFYYLPTSSLYFTLNDASSHNNLIAVVTGMADNRWHHFAASADAANLYAYADGVLVGSTPRTVVSMTYVRDPYIGSFTGTTKFLPGSLDDIQIYSRARYAPEIRTQYLSSLAGYPGVLNHIPTTIAPPTGSGLLLQQRRAA